ncbi:chemotaxis response - phosphatase CheZ [Halorhodospira halochloris]|uniref:Protein phosphatase CheZ n=1 Tax=Halorhodospira halochloris TaxID=1052 RepID=A0A0X8XB72_HALHR|nr:protein phosphatase CheZ [Halorhodospira halochloris]MBK1651835.1 chemotaxis protein CheZ [Halorhodospira halochloris]MCG5548249.1 protein phosphatase CheZ [Halorhodospira halochloris]BAU58830.1 chemotaxis response - phosphatase CheZ [Halorhodospira halochloris]
MALDSTTPENASLEDYRSAAQQLLECVDAGDVEGAQSVIDDLTHLRETELFRELGTLTRELHEAIKAFHYDERLADITESEIPDARERLNYVITMTEQAAHRTLTMIEETTPLVQWVAEEGERLAERWQAFRQRDLDVEQFRQLCRDLDEFLSHLQENGHKVTSQLNDALMAQDYQDLTGQIIRRVIALVEEVEGNLVQLVRISGQRIVDDPQRSERKQSEASERMQKGEGPSIPGGDNEGVVSGQDEVDDLLSSLGF